MAEVGKKLGTLSIAILENFVQTALGEKFVDELRTPTDRELAIAKALGETESLFVSQFEDKDLSKALFVDLKQTDRPVLKEAAGKFFDHPTDTSLPQALQQILFDEFQRVLSKERIQKAVYFYIKILTEELALADDTFRENVRSLADLHGETSRQEMVDILRRVESLLAQRELPAVAPAILRPLHQLPLPPSDFTWREELIKQLLEDFAKGKGATITGPVGMGGIGKTALGLVVAHQIAKDYPDAQIFLDLKGTTTPLSAAEIMRHVIHSFEPTMDLRALDETGLSNAYRTLLNDKRTLFFWITPARPSRWPHYAHPRPAPCW